MKELLNENDLRVIRNDGVLLFWMGGTCQGRTDAMKPWAPVSSYMRAMCKEIPKEAKTFLFIGLGAGSMPTKYVKMGKDVVVVEPRKDVFDVAVKYFKFPHKKATVFLGTGEQIVPNLSMFDVIVIDAHTGESHPKEIYCQTFYDECRKHLNQGGMILVNEIVQGENKILIMGNEVKG